MARINGLELPGLNDAEALYALDAAWHAIMRGPMCSDCKTQIRSAALVRAREDEKGRRWTVCVDCYEGKR